MIVPMKKVCLVVQESSRNEALLKLREAGVVHLEKKAVPEGITKAGERKTKVENAIGLLSDIKIPKKKKPAQTGTREMRRKPIGLHRGRRSTDIFGSEEEEPFSLDAVRVSARPYLPDLINNIGRDRKLLQDRTAHLTREISRVEPWGDFDPEQVKEMASLGLPVYLYELNKDAFSSIPDDLRYVKISGASGNRGMTTRLVVLDSELPGLTPFQLPEKSLSSMKNEVDEIKLDMEELNAKLNNFADRHPVLLKEIENVLKDIEFENASASMEIVEDTNTELSYLTGFVPVDEIANLKKAVSENNWALSADDPGQEDIVPTKLKYNRAARLLKPLTDFLEVTPGYNEVDISGWFLFFFVIFFGMIFGDALYGGIILIASLIGIIKTIKKVPLVLKLMLVLGLSNFVWGVITCTWAGIDADKLPQFLQNISLPLISNVTAAKSVQDEGIVRQNLMIICFSLALLQLSIGHIIAITRCRSLKVLAEIGSIAMLVGMYGVVLILIASNEYRNLAEYIPMMPCVYALGAGFIFNFAFSSYEGSVGKSILESLKNIISMILGIANVFSDIMSYIRLWAVGLAGGAIASTVVTMAGPMLGHFIFFIFGIVLLVFGHGLNLVLNVLSVLVHGVRLNTLEFSGHVGLTWAGTAYKPFKEKERE